MQVSTLFARRWGFSSVLFSTGSNRHLSFFSRRPALLLSLMLLTAGQPSLAQTVAGLTPGELAVSPSGGATYSIPIAVPPGVAGMQPELSLNYNSQGGNGPVGVGWSLSGLSAITRCPRTFAQDGHPGGIYLDANDRFCLDGQRLIVTSGTDGGNGAEYRTEIDSFSKITSHGGVRIIVRHTGKFGPSPGNGWNTQPRRMPG